MKDAIDQKPSIRTEHQPLREDQKLLIEKMFEDNVEAIYRHVFWRTGKNHQDADDIVADVYIRAMLILDRYNPEMGEPEAWLIGIANKIIYERYKQNGRLAPYIDQSYEQADYLDEENIQLKIDLEEALEELSRDEESLITMKYRDEQKEADIAEFLKIPIGTVKSRLSRARQKLRWILTPKGYHRK